MKNKIARIKKFVQDHPIPLAAAAGSVATFAILAKTDRLDLAHNYTWYSFETREDLAKKILEYGHLVIDCNHCDRSLTLIVVPQSPA
jgi:hypothetical protein